MHFGVVVGWWYEQDTTEIKYQVYYSWYRYTKTGRVFINAESTGMILKRITNYYYKYKEYDVRHSYTQTR